MDYAEEVQRAQLAFTAGDRCATLVALGRELNWTDAWHSGTQDYLDLGAAFADALRELEASCP